MDLVFQKGRYDEETLKDILNILYEDDLPHHDDIVENYFKKKYLIYFASAYFGSQPFAYCIVKEPTIRPETATVVHSKWRNKGIATKLRNYVLEQREFFGNIVYSSCELSNPASFKSILKSDYHVFDLTKDGYIQFTKILPYK